MRTQPFPFGRTALAAVALAASLLLADAAHAEEIELIDLETCETSTKRVAEIVSETWSAVTVRERRAGRGPTEEIPTIRVVSIERSDGATGEKIVEGRRELDRANYAEAAQILKSVSGGGYRVQADTGKRIYNSFDAGDPKGRSQRPSWESEYAHFFYAKAVSLQGQTEEDDRVLREALLALDDLPVPDAEDDRQTSGGFLGRFAGGNSRFYPEAMMLKARTLVALGRYEDAEATFTDLGEHAVAVPLHPRWAYEAAIGPGRVKEAQGDESGAIDAYNAAAAKVLALLKREMRACLRLELGRLYSRAQVLATAVKLRQAEKSSNRQALLGKLRTELEGMRPESLRRRYRTATRDVQDALVQGARDPLVRAVANNGIGLAYLEEERFEEAVVAFKRVTVIFFEIEEQALRASHYLAKAAAGAAKEAEGSAKEMYASMADEAREAVEGTEWENK